MVNIRKGFKLTPTDKGKRIEELEATNKKISDECHKLVGALEKKRKENEELKKKNLNAKEIIKKLMVFAEIDNREYEEVYKEAEQFLKETK